MRPTSAAEPGKASLAGRALAFAGLAAGVVAALIAVGYVPTRRLGGPEAVSAMLAGCAVSLTAAAVGALPLLLGGAGDTPHGRVNRILGALGLRLAAVVVVGAGAVLSGLFAAKPLLLWIALSYLALLAVETMFAVSSSRSG